MFVSGFVSIILNFTTLGPLLFSEIGILPSYYKFPMVVLFTTVIWVLVTLFTNPDSSETLINFCKKHRELCRLEILKILILQIHFLGQRMAVDFRG